MEEGAKKRVCEPLRRVGVLTNQLNASAATAASHPQPQPQHQQYLRQQSAAVPEDLLPLPEGEGGGTSEYLRGGFAPVAGELDVPELAVAAGSLPASLRGSFVRNGPNPQFDFRGRQYHWFDGDAMLHMVTFGGTADDGGNGGSGGNGAGSSAALPASYRNRFVRTARFLADAAAGYSVAELGELHAGNFAPALRRDGVDTRTGERMGRANTSVVAWRGELLCLEENDKPYAVCRATLATLGRRDFGGALSHNVTAHPKLDPATGELFLFGYDLSPRGPWCSYAVACGETGELTRSFPVPLPAPVMMHDMALTQRFAVLCDWRYEFSVERMLAERSAATEEGGGAACSPFRHARDKPPRFGVLPRYAASAAELRWFELAAPMSLFHIAAAWEQPRRQQPPGGAGGGTELVIVGCRGETADLAVSTSPDDEATVQAATAAGGDAGATRGQRLWEWRLDLGAAGTVTERQLGQQWIEFATVHPALTCCRPRYVYAARFCHRPDSASPNAPWIDGVVKHDLETGVERVHAFPPGHFGGEPVFAPAGGGGGGGSTGGGAEDEGFLLTFVTDERRQTSELFVIDARDEHFAAAPPRCRLRMPRVVPYGFHGTWLPDK